MWRSLGCIAAAPSSQAWLCLVVSSDLPELEYSEYPSPSVPAMYVAGMSVSNGLSAPMLVARDRGVLTNTDALRWDACGRRCLPRMCGCAVPAQLRM